MPLIDGTIKPKLESIEDFKNAKAQSDENLKLLHKQQYARMLRSDKAGMAALDEKIKAEEARQDALKMCFAQAMGAGVSGKSGNMLLGNRMLFMAGDVPKMYTGADDEEPIATTPPDPTDPSSSFWYTHVMPDPFNPSDPNLANAPLIPGIDEDGNPEKKRNDAYGSLPDDYADTGLVEPPEGLNVYKLEDADYLTSDEISQILIGMKGQREYIEKLGVPSAYMVNHHVDTAHEEVYEGALDRNNEILGQIDEQMTELKEKYIQKLKEENTIKISDGVKQKYSGDKNAICMIKGSKMFQQLASYMNSVKYYQGLEAKLKLEVYEMKTEQVTAEEANKLYETICSNKDTETDVLLGTYGAMLGIAIAPLPIAAGTVIAVSASAAEIALSPESAYNPELYGVLGGTYTISSFVLDSDWDIVEIHGGGKHKEISGYVIYGEPIMLSTGKVIENPLNGVFYNSK